MRGNIAQLMQQAQKMQEDMQRVQEELARTEVTGNAGGGMVSVTLTGRMECRTVRTDPAAMSAPEMAEDLVEIGRAACQARVCTYVYISVSDCSFKTINTTYNPQPR